MNNQSYETVPVFVRSGADLLLSCEVLDSRSYNKVAKLRRKQSVAHIVCGSTSSFKEGIRRREVARDRSEECEEREVRHHCRRSVKSWKKYRRTQYRVK